MMIKPLKVHIYGRVISKKFIFNKDCISKK